MSARPLVIGPAELARIAELRAFAAGNVRDAAAVLAVAAKDMEAFRDAMQAHCTLLPMGFRVCYSHERQPQAPPPGICAHLSVSVDQPELLPSVEAVNLILDAFGMAACTKSAGVWVEEISPGERAVNVLQLLPSPGPAPNDAK